MEISLRHQTVVITGGAKRIGRAVALECAASGANVVLTYRNSQKEALETLETLHRLAPDQKFAAHPLEVSDGDAVLEFRNRVVADFGRVHGLVNCAGVFNRTPFETLSEADFDTSINANLKGPFLLCKAFGDHFLESGGGAIVNFADIYALRPLANFAPYCVSKAGVVMLTESLAKALTPTVRVNCLCPGTIFSPAEAHEGDEHEGDESALLRRIPMGRFGTGEEIAQTVVFLLGGPQFITGAILPVDGGQRLR